MSSERRQHYRVSIATEREVHVAVRDGSGPAQQDGQIDVSAGGVAIGVSVDNALQTRSGQQIFVDFHSERLGEPLSIAGHLRHIKRSDDGRNIMYGIAFDPWSESRIDLTPKLRSLFNEREAVRVEPNDDESVEIQMVFNGHDHCVNGTLRDISVFGLGVWMSVDDAQILSNQAKLTLDFCLPTGQKELSMEVEVRHLQAVGERSRLGLRFCSEDAQVRRAQQRDITQYVMSRQIEIARIDAERRRAMGSHYPTR